MSTRVKDFVVVYMVDEAKVGDRFSAWPLHMTLLTWFVAPDLRVVQEKLKQTLVGFKAFSAEVGEREYLGQSKLAARLVTITPQLRELHDVLLRAVNDNGWELKGRYVGEQFKPHITEQAGRNAIGVLVIDKIFIAEKLPQGYRELVDRIDFV